MDSRAKPTVSAVVITYNEERKIRGCLESLRWADEIILIDSGSTDRTVSIAKEFSARIVPRPWPGCFSAQRNVGLALAQGDWLLVLDADERLTPEGQREMATWLSGQEAERYAAAQVPRRNYFFGKWLRFGGAYPDWQWRLLRRGKVTYDERTSDTAVIDGPCNALREPIDHLTGDTIGDRIRKTFRDADYKARELHALHKDASWPDVLFRPAAAGVKVYVLKQGFRDGVEGVIYAVLASLYTFIRYVRLWELSRGGAR